MWYIKEFYSFSLENYVEHKNDWNFSSSLLKSSEWQVQQDELNISMRYSGKVAYLLALMIGD